MFQQAHQQQQQHQMYVHHHQQQQLQQQHHHQEHASVIDPSTSIIDLNNRGVEYLHLGQTDTAVVALAHALAAVKQRSMTMSQQQQKSHPPFVVNDEDLSDWFSNLLMASGDDGRSSSATSRRRRTRTRRQQRLSSSTTTFLYQEPIELPMDNEMSTLLNVQCVTVMFNLAMAFHLRALAATGSNDNVHQQLQQQQHFLHNAIQMYELCYEMMSTDESFNPGLYFIMCLANNLGCAHMTLGNYAKSHSCFEHLLSMQMYVTDSSIDGSASTSSGSTSVGSSNGTSGSDQARRPPQHRDMYPSAESSSNNKDAVDSSEECTMDTTADCDDEDYHPFNHDNDGDYHAMSSPFDGFLQNTSRLILLDNCASAA